MTILDAHKLFGVTLLRESLSDAGVVHIDYRVDNVPETIQIWRHRRNANDTFPPRRVQSKRPDVLKQMFVNAILESAGMEATSMTIGTEPGSIDVYFEPYANALPAPGLLGDLTRSAAIMSPFHLDPGPRDIAIAQLQQLSLWITHCRNASPDEEVPLVKTWLIVTEPLSELFSDYALERRANPAWPPGVYTGPAESSLHAVVLRELPLTRSTLLLRLLGTGTVLEKALAEQAALPVDAPERRATRAALRAALSPGKSERPIHIDEHAHIDIARACHRAYLRWAQDLEE